MISVGAELCQVILMYRWCAFPWLGIYGYLIAMLFTGIAAFALNFMILYRKVGFSLRPLRRFGVPLLCGATLFFWTRIFYQMFSQICHSDIAALVCTVGGVGILYIVVLRLMGIRLFLLFIQANGETIFTKTAHVVNTLTNKAETDKINTRYDGSCRDSGRSLFAGERGVHDMELTMCCPTLFGWKALWRMNCALAEN